MWDQNIYILQEKVTSNQSVDEVNEKKKDFEE